MLVYSIASYLYYLQPLFGQYRVRASARPGAGLGNALHTIATIIEWWLVSKSSMINTITNRWVILRYYFYHNTTIITIYIPLFKVPIDRMRCLESINNLNVLHLQFSAYINRWCRQKSYSIIQPPKINIFMILQWIHYIKINQIIPHIITNIGVKKIRP